MPAQIKPKSFELRQTFFFFLPRADACHVYMGAMLLPQSYQYPNLSEGTVHTRGQLHGDKECPFSGVTNSGSLAEGAGKRCLECVLSHMEEQVSAASW